MLRRWWRRRHATVAIRITVSVRVAVGAAVRSIGADLTMRAAVDARAALTVSLNVPTDRRSRNADLGLLRANRRR